MLIWPFSKSRTTDPDVFERQSPDALVNLVAHLTIIWPRWRIHRIQGFLAYGGKALSQARDLNERGSEPTEGTLPLLQNGLQDCKFLVKVAM